jgi:hypothetical protein
MAEGVVGAAAAAADTASCLDVLRKGTKCFWSPPVEEEVLRE